MIPPPPPLPVNNPHQMEANRRLERKPMENPPFMICMNAINILTHFFLGAITFSAFSYAITANFFAFDERYWHNFHGHVYLCVIGYVVLMSQAMLVSNPYVGWGTYLHQSHKRIIHIIMQILGSVLAIIGSMMKFYDWTPTFNSAHAILGFTAMILTIFSLIGGIINFIVTERGNKNATIDLGSTCITAVTITVAFIALILAFHQNYRLPFNHPAANLSIAFTVFALAGILILVFVKYVKK